jgi:hypothetical protein
VEVSEEDSEAVEEAVEEVVDVVREVTARRSGFLQQSSDVSFSKERSNPSNRSISSLSQSKSIRL